MPGEKCATLKQFETEITDQGLRISRFLNVVNVWSQETAILDLLGGKVMTILICFNSNRCMRSIPVAE